MKREPKKPRRPAARAPDGPGVAGDEATGQIPTGPAPNPATEKARRESGQGPTRGVEDQEERE